MINFFNISNAVTIESFDIDKSRLLSQVHCAIFTSKYEGLPNVLLEYMSYNLPIIYNECRTGVEELMCTYNLGVKFKFQDKFSLARQMVDFKTDDCIEKKSNSQEILHTLRVDFNNKAIKYFK